MNLIGRAENEIQYKLCLLTDLSTDIPRSPSEVTAVKRSA